MRVCMPVRIEQVACRVRQVGPLSVRKMTAAQHKAEATTDELAVRGDALVVFA